jgi:hypothetical protein
MTAQSPSAGEPAELSERTLRAWHRIGFGLQPDARHTPMSVCRLTGNGQIQSLPDRAEAFFAAGGDSHRMSFLLPVPLLSNGLSVRIRLSGWGSIRYVACGYSCDGVFRHIKVLNPAQARWFDITIGHGDIGFGLQNNWEHPASAMIGDIRIDMRGEPLVGGARIEVQGLLCWEEESAVTPQPATCTRPPVLPPRAAMPAGWREAVHAYLGKVFRHADDQARAFMTSGLCPLMSGARLPWPPDAALPTDLADVNTHVFSWHALHPASILLLHARNTGRDAAVYAARDVVSQWLERSYYAPDPDSKYAWYDHGVAERMLALLLIWAEGIDRDFDQRFMTRVGEAIVRHAQLLESELFYALHQRVRYHNHAWFQDVALLAAATAFPDYPSAARWRDRACERLAEQMETLIVRDGGFAVSIENSIGYQHSLQRLADFAGALTRLAGTTSVVADVAHELSAFSDFLRYPDGSRPAQGDSSRSPTGFPAPTSPSSPVAQPAFAALPKAGYGVVKGEHDGIPFMFCMFATSLSKTHKHEDDLSFTLFFDGIEWLIDPSFYSHEYQRPLPAYLRSAAAHNAICLSGVAYSIEPGLARLQGICEDDAFRFEGSHSCYADTTMTRTVDGTMKALDLQFTDGVWGTGEFPEASLMLQCGDDVVATRYGARLILSHPRSRFQLELSLPSERIEIAVGEESEARIRGISGLGFMQKVAISTIECHVPTGQPVRWTIRAVYRPVAHSLKVS